MRCYYCSTHMARGQTACPACKREQPTNRPLGTALWVGGAALGFAAGTVGEPGRLRAFDPAAQPVLGTAAMICSALALALSVVVFARWWWVSGSLKRALLQLLGYLLVLQVVGFMARAPNGIDFPS